MKKAKIIMGILFGLCLTAVTPTVVKAADTTVIETDVSEPSTGCMLMGWGGIYYENVQEAIDLINSYRKEACEEGVQNPASSSGAALTEDDYVEIKWSADLEYIARIRAAEASITKAHTRTNGKSCFKISSNGISSSNEVIAFNYSTDMTAGIKQWYSEKSDWVDQTSGATTGHYTAMINPNNTYVGLGLFDPSAGGYSTTAGEFCKSSSTLDTTQMTFTGTCIQKLEVCSTYITTPYTLTGSTSGKSGETAALTMTSANNLTVYDGATWSSSASNVASVDDFGNVTGVTCGTTTITAMDPSDNSVSMEYTVEHSYDAGTVTTQPTCTVDGVRTYTCSVCDDKKTESIAATGHQNKKTENAKDATCTEKGYTGDTYCTDCNTKLESGSEIAATGHSWDKGTVTTSPSCTEAGVKTYTCAKCKGTKTESIAATGHQNTETRGAKTATCTEKGYTGDTYCTDCNTKLEGGSEIAATGHQNKKTENAKAATCTETGYTGDIYCTDCNTKIETGTEIPATGHQNKEIRNQKSATCTETGYTGDTYCKDCDTLLESGTEEPRLSEHSYGSWNTVSAATISSPAKVSHTCKYCGYTEAMYSGSKATPTVSVTAESVKLKVKQKAGFSVWGLANGDSVVSASSSNTKVLKVSGSGGSYTLKAGKKTGKSTLTIGLKSGLTKNITVKVQKKKVKCTSIGNVQSVTLKKGQTLKLSPTKAPYTCTDKFKYKSSKKKVATVSGSGVIKAKKKGKTTITISVGSKKKKITVKVI